MTLAIVLVTRIRRRLLTRDDVYVFVILVATFGVLVLARDDFPGFFLLVAAPGIPWALAMSQRATAPLRPIALTLWSVLALLGLISFPRADAGWYPVRVGYGEMGRDGTGAGWAALFNDVLAATRQPGGEGCTPRLDLPQSEEQLARGHLRWAVLVDHPVEDRRLEIDEGWSPDEFEREADESRRLGESVVLLDDGPQTKVPEASVRPVLEAAGFRPVRRLEAPDGRAVVVWRPPPIASC